ncbi:hypothetical protein GQ43DRAFT_260921 [Delitschia confertaspora ATCC 74209]|uniref:Uncharacterized protein n=1 Tax=Delitschia confertaspora ATCC 74209 TaxID=1513339 RepID=A0A9P4MQV6_9PLEO|nr:hypothetical protein GQ43DRAFT_260921 [Delitschia confertaspora ATCC 74209]
MKYTNLPFPKSQISPDPNYPIQQQIRGLTSVEWRFPLIRKRSINAISEMLTSFVGRDGGHDGVVRNPLRRWSPALLSTPSTLTKLFPGDMLPRPMPTVTGPCPLNLTTKRFKTCCIRASLRCRQRRPDTIGCKTWQSGDAQSRHVSGGRRTGVAIV